MLYDHPDRGQLVSAPSASKVVELHYAKLDAWCPPQVGFEINESFRVVVFEIPEGLEDETIATFENLDGDAYPAAISEFRRTHPSIELRVVEVCYNTGQGAIESEDLTHPDLFDGGGES